MAAELGKPLELLPGLGREANTALDHVSMLMPVGMVQRSAEVAESIRVCPKLRWDPRGRGSVFRDAQGRWAQTPEELRGMPPQSQWGEDIFDVRGDLQRARIEREIREQVEASQQGETYFDALLQFLRGVFK